MSGRIYPRMLTGGISGYFSFKCMAFYNKHLLSFTLSMGEKMDYLLSTYYAAHGARLLLL